MATQVLLLPIPAITLLAVIALLLIWLGTKNKDMRMRAAGEIMLALVFFAVPVIITVREDNDVFSLGELWASVLSGMLSGASLTMGALDLIHRGQKRL